MAFRLQELFLLDEPGGQGSREMWFKASSNQKLFVSVLYVIYDNIQ